MLVFRACGAVDGERALDCRRNAVPVIEAFCGPDSDTVLSPIYCLTTLVAMRDVAVGDRGGIDLFVESASRRVHADTAFAPGERIVRDGKGVCILGPVGGPYSVSWLNAGVATK